MATGLKPFRRLDLTVMAATILRESGCTGNHSVGVPFHPFRNDRSSGSHPSCSCPSNDQHTSKPNSELFPRVFCPATAGENKSNFVEHLALSAAFKYQFIHPFWNFYKWKRNIGVIAMRNSVSSIVFTHSDTNTPTHTAVDIIAFNKNLIWTHVVLFSCYNWKLNPIFICNELVGVRLLLCPCWNALKCSNNRSTRR